MQKLRQKLVVLFIFFTLLPNLLVADVKCIDFFKNEYLIEKDQRLDDVIKRKRARSLKKVEIKEYLVNKVTYKVLGLLGEGSSSVYLAVSPQGQHVVIKHIKKTEETDLEWINSIYYEVRVTQYYLSQGLIVPQIIDYEIVRTNNKLQEGFLVKEYREGLTRDEFLEARGLSFLFGPKYIKIKSAYKKSEKEMTEIHAGFRRWLRDNGIDLYRYRFAGLSRMIENGDHTLFGHQNWMFDIKTYQWVLFDP